MGKDSFKTEYNTKDTDTKAIKEVRTLWKYYNPNPKDKNTGDCAVRAIAKAMDITWEKAKLLLDAYSMEAAEVETSDLVWGRILAEHGFRMKALYCNDGCTLEGLCRKYPMGVYVVKLPNHVVCIENGNYYDSWDSGKEIPIYCWEKI